MARKTSRRRTSRKSRLRSNRRRRVRRNMFGANFQHEVLMPVLSGAAGFVAARYLGNMIAMKDWGTVDPRRGKLYAALLGIPIVYIARQKTSSPFLSRHANTLALGIGLSATEAYLRNTKMLGGSPAAAVLVPEGEVPASAPPAEVAAAENAAGGLSAYYTQDMLNGMGAMEPVSTVIPTDDALPATNFPQWEQVTEKFTNQGDRGHAGGIFARQLFSGMMGG